MKEVDITVRVADLPEVKAALNDAMGAAADRDRYRKALEDIYGWKADYQLNEGMEAEWAEERARKALFDDE